MTNRKHTFEEYEEAIENSIFTTPRSCNYIIKYYKHCLKKNFKIYDINNNTFLSDPNPVEKAIGEKLQLLYEIFEAYLDIHLVEEKTPPALSHYKIAKNNIPSEIRKKIIAHAKKIHDTRKKLIVPKEKEVRTETKAEKAQIRKELNSKIDRTL